MYKYCTGGKEGRNFGNFKEISEISIIDNNIDMYILGLGVKESGSLGNFKEISEILVIDNNSDRHKY